MRPIFISSIPHNTQRYETVGDYYEDGETTQIRVSEMGNEDYEFCVAIHELVEQYICKKRGIKEENISAFDIAFEAARQPGNDEEPGDQPEAPYHKEHVFAECIERLVAREVAVNWKDYTETVMSL